MDKESVRLDKFLSNAHVGTRSEVKEYIKCGMVQVNSVTIRDPAYHVLEDDIVTFGGEQILGHRNIYILLHKPTGYVSTTSDREPSVLNLVDHPYLDELHIAGRLDKDVEGLLILTNDGDFTHKLISPKKHVEKEYHVHTARPIKITDSMKALVHNGIILDNVTRTMPGKIEQLSENLISITIVEGKYHQIKKMCAVLGIEWSKIIRIRIGNLRLGELEYGKWKEITREEAVKCLGQGCDDDYRK
ncbi:MAG: pseudouridine synthase [Fervidobacterium sp.]